MDTHLILHDEATNRLLEQEVKGNSQKGDATMSRSFRKGATIALLTCGWLGQSADAYECRWTGVSSNYWTNDANWFTVGAGGSHFEPRSVDTATLFTSPSGIVLPGDHTAPINGLRLSNGIHLFTNGHRLEVDNGLLAEATITGVGTQLFVTPRSDDPANRALEMDRLYVESGADVFILGSRGQLILFCMCWR